MFTLVIMSLESLQVFNYSQQCSKWVNLLVSKLTILPDLLDSIVLDDKVFFDETLLSPGRGRPL